MMSIADKIRFIARDTAERAAALEAWSKPIASIFAPAMRADADRLYDIAAAVSDIEDALTGGGKT